MRGQSLQRSITANAVALAVNYLVPLVTLPFLTRTLGTIQFGHLVLVQTWLAIATVAIDFGFSYTAARRISALRDHPLRLNDEFTITFVTQLALAAAAVVVFIGGWILFYREQIQPSLFVATLLAVSSAVMVPSWLYSGLERADVLAGVQVSARLTQIPLLLLVVRDSSDTAAAMWCIALSSVLGGLLSVRWIFIRQKFRLVGVDPRRIIQRIKDDGGFFSTRIGFALYTFATPLLVSALAGAQALGYYALADRVRGVMQALAQPVSQALFPRMSLLLGKAGSLSEVKTLLKRCSLPLAIAIGAAALLVGWQAERVVTAIGGTAYSAAALPLRIMVWVPVASSITNVFGVQLLIAAGRVTSFNKAAAMAVFVWLVAVAPLVYFFRESGAATSLLLAESSLALLCASAVYMVFRKRAVGA